MLDGGNVFFATNFPLPGYRIVFLQRANLLPTMPIPFRRTGLVFLPDCVPPRAHHGSLKNFRFPSRDPKPRFRHEVIFLQLQNPPRRISLLDDTRSFVCANFFPSPFTFPMGIFCCPPPPPPICGGSKEVSWFPSFFSLFDIGPPALVSPFLEPIALKFATFFFS